MRRLCPLLVVGFIGSAYGSPVLVDRVVAGIEGGEVTGGEVDVITATEVETAAELALAERRGRSSARVSDALRRAALDQIIAEVLVFREAERLGLTEVSPGEIADARQVLAQRIAVSRGGEESPGAELERFLLRARMSESELEVILARRVAVQRYVQTNLRASIDVTDDDLERAYSAGSHPFQGRPLVEIREVLRAYLVEQGFRGAVERWVRVLRQRSRVRILEP